MNNASPKPDSRRRQALVGVRLLPAEYERVRQLADERGSSLAEVLRTALLRDLELTVAAEKSL